MSDIVASLPTVWIDRVGPVEGVEIVAWDVDGEPPRPDIRFACMPYQMTTDGFEHLGALPQLETVQLLSAGFEHALPFVGDGVRLANARGVHASATAEQALALTLAMQRGIWTWVDGHRGETWNRMSFQPGLADKAVLVVGYGDIGVAITRRVLAFEPSRVTAVASRARAGDDLVDTVHGIDELPGLLPEHDVVVLIVPLTEATQGLVDADFLAAMKEGSLLVNVARGKVVDTDALVAACASGRVRAALDVTDPEPLPDGHPLWTTPGVLVSPHVGGVADGFWSRATAMLRGQLERLGSGQTLDNVVKE